jgi:lipoate-protein ligase A
MAYQFRLLETGRHDGSYNMGLDEALLESVAGGALPCLRLYGWQPPSVSIGYFQGLLEEVDLEVCKKQGVDVVRRISGGGAVFHHQELTYSLVIPESHPLAIKDINASYEKVCAGIIAGLSLLGIETRFVPINDIQAGDRKLSGNAQTRRSGCVLQHGTILLDNDVDLMFELLRVPSEKIKGKIIEDIRGRVTSLKALNITASFEEAADALAEGFRRVLNLDFLPSAPTGEEDRRAQALAAEKFSAHDWLFKR